MCEYDTTLKLHTHTHTMLAIVIIPRLGSQDTYAALLGTIDKAVSRLWMKAGNVDIVVSR
jgi:hypothetical protein